MSDLIERLRINQGEIFGPTMQESADEIERLQAQITAMTKDMDSLEKQLEMADAAIEKWREENEGLREELDQETKFYKDLERENEELRKSWEAQCESADKLFDELAALKAQNTEPVAWMNPANKAVIGAQKKKQIGVGSHYPQFSEPLYTTPPTATALVEDFKQRAVEACDRKLRIERCPQDETYNDAIEECIIAIESLSLMGEEK